MAILHNQYILYALTSYAFCLYIITSY